MPRLPRYIRLRRLGRRSVGRSFSARLIIARSPCGGSPRSTIGQAQAVQPVTLLAAGLRRVWRLPTPVRRPRAARWCIRGCPGSPASDRPDPTSLPIPGLRSAARGRARRCGRSGSRRSKPSAAQCGLFFHIARPAPGQRPQRRPPAGIAARA